MNKVIVTVAVFLIATSSLFNAGSVGAQPDSATVEEMVLTIVEDGDWSYQIDENGAPRTNMAPMMIDGEPQLEFAPSVLETYESHQMVTAYAWSAEMLPAYYDPVSTSIEIRVLTFVSEDNAMQFLDHFYDQLVLLSSPEAHVTAIDPMPVSELNLIGISSMADFKSYESGDSIGHAGSVRYLTQIDNTVISVSVTGPFVDYNFDIAYWLSEAQAACIVEATPCAPVTMPNGGGRWTLTERGIVFQTEGDAENEWAQWIFPLEKPVTAPEWSVTIP